MKKILITTMLAAVSAMAISASRIGPVSTYGELKASGGKLVGSCPEYANTAVQVKGMSLFWSSGADSSTTFYSEPAVNLMVKDMKIEVLRFAMGVSNEFDKGRGYATGGKDLQLAMLKNVVNAAIDNDIYIIIDWHIESSTGYTEQAKDFFEIAAREYGSYNNVIFEIWNEPTGDMGTVKSHADAVIPVIRKYSDNLILVGSPGWSSQPHNCASAGINDNNYGCTLHFYAATHQVGGGYDGNASQAMSAGVPVFATEWGTVSADGNGGANQGASEAWINWMNQNKVSWANWSASAVPEGSAAFTKLNIDNGLTYSTSGNMVKGWMNTNVTYKDCGLQNGNASSKSGFSEGVADGVQTDIIDDMEDGDRYAYSGGFWSAFTDANESGDNGVGKSSITNGTWENDFGKTVFDVLMPSDGGKNTSKYMVGLKGIKLAQGTYEYAPYVALGLNLTKDTTNIDLGACNAISYKYKGARHQFRVETSLVTNWNFHYVEKDATDEWKEVELSWDQFKQEDWGDNDKHFNLKTGMDKVNRFGWFIKGALGVPDAQNQPKYDYLYVDDVRCDGVSIKAISTLAAAASSSSAPVTNPNSSSSVVTPTSSDVISGSSGSGPTTQIVSVVDIDNVEDVNEVATTGGTWYAYTDSAPGGLSSITNVVDPALPGYVVTFPGTEDATNGTAGFVGIKGIVWNQGTYAEAPFVALGLNTNADTSLGIDLSACSAISYRYKGAKHIFKVQDGSVTDYAYHQRKVDTTSVWTEVVLEKTSIKQPTWTQDPKEFNWAGVKKMAWEVVGAKGTPDYQPEYNYLYVDDLKCVNVITSVKDIRLTSNSIKLGFQGSNLTVNLDKSGAVRIQVFDMMGHVVENIGSSMNAGANTVSLEKLGRGNYVVRVIRGSEVKAARVTIR